MSVIRFFQTGGPFMYPIAIVLVIGLAIACRALDCAEHRPRRRNRKAFATNAMGQLKQ